MASYNAIIEPSSFVEDALRCSQSIINAGNNDPILQGKLESIVPLAQSSRTFVAESNTETSRSGTKVDSFLDDYYYRIHVTPSLFDLGPILSDLSETFIVWNAYFVSKTCSQISAAEPAEAPLSGLTTPFTLNALCWTMYTINVPSLGQPEFTSIYTFDFGSPNIIPVTITAIRLIAFVWCAQAPVNESLEWKTDVLKAKNGAEQRMAMRQAPRQSFNFSIKLDDPAADWLFGAKLWSRQKRMWGLPVWPEMVRHITTVSSGDTTITVDTTSADFRAQSMAIIWQDSSHYEIVRINTLTSSILNLKSPVVNTYTGIKYIIPLRLANLVSNVTQREEGNGLITADLQFTVQDNIAISGFTPALSYKGIPVQTIPPETENSFDEDSDANITITDFATGNFEVFSDDLYNADSITQTFFNDLKSQCWNFRQMLHYLNGMQNTIWLPSFKTDFALAQTLGGTETVLTIANIGFSKNYGINPVTGHLAFIFTDGTIICRDIVGATDNGTTELISIDSSLGKDATALNCKISIMRQCRLAADRAEIAWDTTATNQSKLAFVGVPQ